MFEPNTFPIPAIKSIAPKSPCKIQVIIVNETPPSIY